MSKSDFRFWIVLILVVLAAKFLCGCATTNTICVDSCKLDQLVSEYIKIQAENAELQAWRDKMFF